MLSYKRSDLLSQQIVSKTMLFCPVCGKESSFVFFKWHGAVVEQQFVMNSHKEALECARGNIDLAFCESCQMIWNQSFNPLLISYKKSYEASQSYSPSFRENLKRSAESLISKYNLHNKRILEIGSGDTFFLEELCALGKNTGVGFEPSWEPHHHDNLSEAVQIIPEPYTDKYKAVQGDFVCARHVLEHVSNPLDFLISLRRLTEGNNPIYFFEVPNVEWCLERVAFWDIYYEHCLYFSQSALIHLFNKCGYKVNAVYESFEGQYICIEAEVGEDIDDFSASKSIQKNQVLNFEVSSKAAIQNMRIKLEEIMRSKQVIIWGAGARAAAFLDLLNCDREQVLLVDINPKKWGKFIPGTGHQIFSPNVLPQNRSLAVIILNPQYEQEIKFMVKEMYISVDFFIYTSQFLKD